MRTANQAIRPGIPVTTPIDIGLASMCALGCVRISVVATADLISGYFGADGIQVQRKAIRALDRHPEMKRLSAACLIEVRHRFLNLAADAQLFSSRA
jgi:hypothetical protein